MKTPDKHIIDRTLDNTATPEEARQVIRWFSTPEGAKYLSSLMDEDAEKIQPGSEELYVERSIPSDENPPPEKKTDTFPGSRHLYSATVVPRAILVYR